MQKLIVLFAVCFFVNKAFTQNLHLAGGSIVRFEHFTSKNITARNVDVWLPPGYSNTKKYAVLYMHDGQMLFDSSTTWNKKEWGVDEAMTELLQKKLIQNCIVVAVWNDAKQRHADYFPQKPFEQLAKTQQDSIYKATQNGSFSLFASAVHSDQYLKFIVKELKPFIDKKFPTFKDRNHTFIAGSSMGGLISLYAICEYPDVFGGAACLSTHWPGLFNTENNPVPAAFLSYFSKHLPSPLQHRIYFDYGTATLDSMYKPYQLQMDEVMKKAGYNSKNWITKEFVGEDHSENAWRKRLKIPLLFLLQQNGH